MIVKMMIKNSLEWNNVEHNLRQKSYGLVYGKEIRKMISNIHPEISDLSRAEIEARRGNCRRADEILVKVNEHINEIEEFLLIAALIG